MSSAFFGLLTSQPGWNALSAAAAGRVYLAEANQNRPGPRLAETLEIVAEILHPENFAFGHGALAGNGSVPPTDSERRAP